MSYEKRSSPWIQLASLDLSEEAKPLTNWEVETLSWGGLLGGLSEDSHSVTVKTNGVLSIGLLVNHKW